MVKSAKGIACRVCKHITEEGKCSLALGGDVNRKDDCWRYQHRDTNNGLAEHSEAETTWN